jgi:GK10316 (fragment)
MPRKAKEEKNDIEVKQASKVAPKTTKTTTKKASTKTTTAKKTATKSTKNSTIIKKVVDSITPKKKKTTAKKTATKTTKKAVKTLTKESIKSTEKEETVKKPTTISGEEFSIAEYYDLPYRYNQTIVKLLYQTPTTLFIYWDISDEDREKYKETYGEDFFEKTKPVLIVHNETKGYSFEVEINDFANCWYLNVNDSKCKYKIELGRKPFEVMYNGEVTEVKTTQKITQSYIPITSSNEVESPNDHILFEKKQEMIYFKNVKNNTVTAKNIASLNFVKSLGKVYKVNDFYKKFYKDEDLDSFDKIQNPSSNSLSSSRFK